MSKIAIIGSGISGLTAAYLLNRSHDVSVFEANDYIGGHTATKEIEVDGQILNIDTGFIVFNDWTYPNFIKLINQLGVPFQNTDMGFSVKCEETGLEYSGTNLDTLFAQRRNLFNKGFWCLIRDILRFNKQAISDLENNKLPANTTLSEYLKKNNYSQSFINHYLIPMGAAIWSSSLNDMMKFPLLFFVRFLKNHGLLSVNHRPQWKVICGGSKSYIDALLPHLKDKIYTQTPIRSVSRNNNSINLLTDCGLESFDHVIFACHSDQALKLLNSPTVDEQSILGAMPYQKNEVVLHTDDSLLPTKQKAWSSWNYHLTGEKENPAAVTYNMNILQGIKSAKTICVTLNNSKNIDPKKVIATYEYSHPVFTLDGLNAQKRWAAINGIENTWFCGAYWFNGFHEDGVNSALRICEAFGETL